MKRKIAAALSILILLLFSGCWSRRELNILALVSSCVYDISQDNKVLISIEIVKSNISLGNKGSGSDYETMITITEGDSITDAWENSSKHLDRHPFLSNMDARFITERFARTDLRKYADSFMRNFEFNKRALVTVIKGNPDLLYECDLSLAKSMGHFINDLSAGIPNSTSKSVFISTLDFEKKILSDGCEPVAGLCEVIDKDSFEMLETSQEEGTSAEQKKYKIKYEGLAAFKDGTLAGYFDGIEARSYNIVTNQFKGAYFSVESGDILSVLEVTECKTDVKLQYKEKVHIKLDIKITAGIVNDNSKLDVSRKETQQVIENLFNAKMEKEIMSALKKAQLEFKSDIFGFGNKFHIKYPEEWRKMKEKWNEHFSESVISLKVNTKIRGIGTIKEQLNILEAQ